MASRKPRLQKAQRNDPRPGLRADPALGRLQAVFGARLAVLREAKGLTQEQAAELVGVTARHLQRVEAGGTNLTLLLLNRFASVYGFEVTTLFGSPDPANND